MIELLVENSIVGLSDIFSTSLNFAIDDVKDFGAKNSPYSKTIILPGTKNNNKLFGQIFDINARNNYNNADKNKGLNFNPSVSANCVLFENHIQVFKGVFRILEVIIDGEFIEYECSLVGELGGFVSKVGNKKLEDLDFSAYDTYYTIANILASASNINTGTGVVFPLIDIGAVSIAKHDFNYKAYRPALFAIEYLKKIVADAGYTLDFALGETNRLKNIVVPYNRKQLTNKNTTALKSFVSTPYFYNTTGGQRIIEIANVQILGSFINGGGGTYFQYNGGSDLDCNITFSVKGSCTNTRGYYWRYNIFILDSSNSVINSVELFKDYNSTNFSFDEKILLDTIIPIGGRIYCTINILPNISGSTTATVSIFQGELLVESKVPQMVNINLGEKIIINDTIPRNYLQKDFFSSIIKLFNLYVFEDKNRPKTLIIKPFVDFYANALTEDWSNKIDPDSPIRLKPMSELNARYYEFNYKDDSDFYNAEYKKRYNKNYGSLIYDSAYEFSKETSKVEVIFSPTILSGIVGQDKVVSAIYKKNGSAEESIDFNIRLLQIANITGVASWNIVDDANNILSTNTNYLYAGHLDNPDYPTNDLNFGVPEELSFQLGSGALNVNQFNLYWSSYMAEITDKDSKLLVAKARLNLKDINDLDFSKLKYIDGSLFRLNKIEEYNVDKEELCNVELIKVINKIY